MNVSSSGGEAWHRKQMKLMNNIALISNMQVDNVTVAQRFLSFFTRLTGVLTIDSQNVAKKKKCNENYYNSVHLGTTQWVGI